MNFGLPIEVHFDDRIKIGIKIGINKRIAKFIELENLINLYEPKLENLKIQSSYPSISETFTISSTIPFTLKGFGIPKLSNETKNKIKISYQQGQSSGLFNNGNFSSPENLNL